MAHSLTYCRQVKRALVDNRIKFGLKVVIPAHVVDILKFEEVSGDHDIEHILVVDLLNHVALFVVVHLLKKRNDELKGLQVACQSDFDALIVTHTLNHRLEMLNVLQCPLLVQ